MYYCYELMVADEYQGIGAFCGVEALDLTDEEQYMLLEDVDANLLYPDFYEKQPDVQTEAYFTDAVHMRFRDTIEKLLFI